MSINLLLKDLMIVSSNYVCEKGGDSRFVGRAGSFLMVTCPRAST